MTFDSLNRLHFVGQLRNPVTAIWHAIWEGANSWARPIEVYRTTQTPQEGIDERIHVHNVDAAIRDNHQLVITFTDPPPDRDKSLYAMHRSIAGLPEKGQGQMPTRAPVALQAAEGDNEEMRLSSSQEVELVAEPPTIQEPQWSDDPAEANPLNSLLWGTIFAFVFVAAVLWVVGRSRRG